MSYSTGSVSAEKNTSHLEQVNEVEALEGEGGSVGFSPKTVVFQSAPAGNQFWNGRSPLKYTKRMGGNAQGVIWVKTPGFHHHKSRGETRPDLEAPSLPPRAWRTTVVASSWIYVTFHEVEQSSLRTTEG